jgi:hypothetical protein
MILCAVGDSSTVLIGSSQYHLSVAGGYAVILSMILRLRTHPLPGGGTDCFQG